MDDGDARTRVASRVKGAGAVFGLAVLTTGCGDSGAAPTYTVRDSAGVRIVESTVPAWRGDEGWRLGTEPSLRIGVVDGPEELQFMRIVGARRLADGRIVVVDAGAAQVRFYDSAGRFIDAYGGQGSGPGEFRSISWAGPYRGDSLAVWDTGARRLTVIDLQSREGRMLQIESDRAVRPPQPGRPWLAAPHRAPHRSGRCGPMAVHGSGLPGASNERGDPGGAGPSAAAHDRR